MVTPREGLQGPAVGGISAPATVPVQSTAGQQVAALGDSLSTAGIQGFRLSREMQRDLDFAKTQEASARFAELLANEEASFDQLRGEAAHKQFDTVRQRVETKRRELEKILTSSTQKTAFGRDATARQTIALNRMNAHRAEQVRVYRIGAATASLDRAMRDRVNAAVKGDAVDYIRQSMVMHRKMEQIADLNNLSDEQKQLALETAEDSVTTAAIEGMLDIGAVARAGDFLNSVDGRIQDPVKRTALEKRIRTAGVKQRAEMLVPDVRQQGDLLEQRRYVNSLNLDVEVKDELMRRIRVLTSEDRAEVAYQRAEAMGKATELALRGQELPEALQTQLDDLGILEQTRQAMEGVTTPQGEYLMETLTPEQLRAFDNPQSLINAYAHELSVADRRRLRARWDAALDEKMRLELAASEQQGGARGRQSAYTSTSEKTVAEVKIDDMIDQYLTDHFPYWQGRDPAQTRNLSNTDVQRLRRIRNAVRMRADSMARALGQTDLTNEVVSEAVRSVLKVRTNEGQAEAGLSPQELREATLSFEFGNETVGFNVARIGLPGEHPDDSARSRFVEAQQALIETAVPEVERQLPGIGPERARQIAAGLVTTADVYRDLARQERNARVQAEQAASLLDAGKPLPPELEQAAGPIQRERNAANSSLKAMWTEMLAGSLARDGSNIARDDEAFIRFWPTFRSTFGSQLRGAYGNRFSTDEDGFRKEAIDLLFSDSSPEQRQRLWRMSGAWSPPGARSSVEGYHLEGYLQSTPEPMEFAHDLNGTKK